MPNKSELTPAGPLAANDSATKPTPQDNLLAVLGPEPESEFDELAELAASMCSTPIGLVTLLGADEQFHKGGVGCSFDRTPRGETFCDYTVRGEGLFTVADAKEDARFRRHWLVDREPGIRFFAGVPLYSPSGDKVGALCVVDSIRRELKPWQRRGLSLLAQQVNARLELRLRRRAAELAFENAAGNDLLFSTFANSLPFPCYLKDREHRLLFYNAPLAERFGVDAEQWLGRTSYDLWPVDLAERIQKAEERVFTTGKPSDLRIQLPGTPAVSMVLHQRLCHLPAGEPVLGVLVLEVL